MTEDELNNVLDEFAAKISNVDLEESKKINFFSATKMLSLETKHSAFFAWLLDPNNDEHCLKNEVSKKLLTKLFNYNKDNVYYNKPILEKLGIVKENQLTSLVSDKIRVKTEQKTHDNKRIDILIDIADSETVIVIENKIDSTTHDNQLCEYEDYIFNHSNYNNYRNKIFVYLTKFGEKPRNNGGKGDCNPKWCILDYSSIRSIVSELVTGLKKTNNQMNKSERVKLIHILEDYIIMVDTSILHTSKVARKKCKELLDDPVIQKAFDILTAYKQIPTQEDIAAYACEKLNGLREGTSSKVWFYTQPMKDYFVKNNEEYKISKLRLVCQAESGVSEESKISIYLNVERKKDLPFSPAQKELLLKSMGNADGVSPSPIQPFPLVERDERGMEFDELKSELDKRLIKFKEILDDFTDKYLK